MNRQAQAVVLLLLGGAVLKASVTDMYLRYVKEGLRPFLIAAALTLLAAAVMTLWYDLRGRASGHGGGHGEPRVGWLLIVPVLGLLLVAPPALGSYAAGQAGTAVTRPRDSAYPPLPAGDPVPVTVLDYASRAVFDQGRSVAQRRVRLTGFLVAAPDGAASGEGRYLVRMIMSCCASDARPIKVGLAGDAQAGVPAGGRDGADTWVEVVGRYTDRTSRDPVNNEIIPYLAVESWRQVPPPRQQYE